MRQRAFVVLPLAGIRPDLVTTEVMESLDTTGVTRLDLDW
jgi:7,8-dihydro-6-hydroxymethylpterin-pyrophosphokinase